MKRVELVLLLAGSLLVSLYGAGRADVIADWNEKAVNAGNTARVGNFPTARAIAMVHLAMFEALNSIEPRYTRIEPGYRRILTLRGRLRPLAPPILVWSACIPNKLRNWIKRCKRHSPLLRMTHPRPKAFRLGNRQAPRYSPSAATMA